MKDEVSSVFIKIPCMDDVTIIVVRFGSVVSSNELGVFSSTIRDYGSTSSLLETKLPNLITMIVTSSMHGILMKTDDISSFIVLSRYYTNLKGQKMSTTRLLVHQKTRALQSI